MCIIIAKRTGSYYDKVELKDSLESAFKWNSHGGGIAIKKAGTNKVILNKGFIYPQVMMDYIDRYDIQDEDEVMIHLRRATAGPINAANCHPYIISDDDVEIRTEEIELTDKSVVSHNGTFRDFVVDKSDFSDTHNFIKEFLSQDGAITALKFLKKLNYGMSADAIGSSNRLCIMSPTEDMVFFGYWNQIQKGTLWYSNYYHSQPWEGYMIKNRVAYDAKKDIKASKYLAIKNGEEVDTSEVIIDHVTEYQNRYDEYDETYGIAAHGIHD